MAEKRDLQNIADTVGTTTVEALAKNSKRTYLLIQNKSAANDLYLTFGEDATVSNGLLIPPGVAYEPPYEVVSSVNLISDSAGTDYLVITNVGAE